MSFLSGVLFRYRWVVVAIWVLALVGISTANQSVGTAFSSSFTLPDTESSRVLDVMKNEFPKQGGSSVKIVFEGDQALTSQENQSVVNKVLARVTSEKIVASVESPYNPKLNSLSNDNKIGFATVYLKGFAGDLDRKEIQALIELTKSYEKPGLEINLSGQAIREASKAKPSSTERVAILAAFFVLLFIFGSFVATLVPLVVAVFALAIGNSLVGLTSNFIEIAEFAPILGALVGLGVGIDYALFIVTRFQRSISEGKSIKESIHISLATSGRAVLFAGVIVCVSMLGLFTVGVNFLNGVGISAAISVLISMVAALTLLPAILAILGTKINRLRIPFKKRSTDEESGTAWRKLAEKIQANPVRWAISSTLILLIISFPATQIRLGFSDSGNDRVGSTTRIAYDTLAQGFGRGFAEPVTLLVDLSTADSPEATAILVKAIETDPNVARVLQPIPTKDGKYQLINLYATTSPQDQMTTEFIDNLRNETLPKVEKETGLDVLVGGNIAIFKDFGELLTSKLPQFILTVVFLSFILLMILFRSLLIPIKAAAMNLLSIYAAFGVLVVGFQWGWFESILGTSAGPIESFLPIMLFAILFGLSMDYEIFLVSRIHEEWSKSGDPKSSVSNGLAATGSIITGAASIMIVVFLTFVFMGDRTIQLFGTGLAVAVLIDATIIRSTLVPALMQIAGKWNWYLPSKFEKILPKIRIED